MCEDEKYVKRYNYLVTFTYGWLQRHADYLVSPGFLITEEKHLEILRDFLKPKFYTEKISFINLIYLGEYITEK